MHIFNSVSTPSPPEGPAPPLPLLTAKHTKYLSRSLNVMPSHARKDCMPLCHFVMFNRIAVVFSAFACE